MFLLKKRHFPQTSQTSIITKYYPRLDSLINIWNLWRGNTFLDIELHNRMRRMTDCNHAIIVQSKGCNQVAGGGWATPNRKLPVALI